MKKKAKYRDNRRVVIREEGRWGEGEEGKEGQTYGDRGKLDFGWWAQNAIHRLLVYIIEFYT